MMRSDEHIRHVHGSYAEETALSLKINVTDEEKSKEIIVHKTLLENQSMDVSESECNIFHENLSQNNSSDVPTNVITELKDDDNTEPSVIDKGSSYFNIFECSRNLLDQLDVTYQRAFTTSQVQQRLYKISAARERYYDMVANKIIETNVGSEGTINDEELRKEITILKSEEEAGNERNIDNMTQEDDYKSPWKEKYATTVNNTLDNTEFTF